MTKKILIVDDEEDILSSVKMLLESMGFKAKTVNNGNAALKLLKEEKFDLVLLDILMPEMSGREVLEAIRQTPKLKNQKVALLTVIELSRPGKEAMKKLFPVDYIQKPLDVADFKKRIKKILK